ncbi:MAG: hypothetical protein AB1Z98_25245 [Nannocystaceae bacterium]
MKVAISQPLDPQAVLPQLQAMLPSYKFSMRGGKIIVAEKSAAVGATVFFRKNKLVVNGAFPNMGLQLAFVLSLFVLGILIPLVIYFLTVYRSQKASENEVGGALQALTSGVPAYPAQPAMAQPQMQAAYMPHGQAQPQLQAGYPQPQAYPQPAYAQPAGYAQPQPGYPQV